MKAKNFSTNLKRVIGKVGFSGWNCEDINLRQVARILQKELTDESFGAFASLPIEFHPSGDGFRGKCPKDPLTVYIWLPISDSDDADGGVVFSFSIANLLKENYAFWQMGDESYSKGSTMFMKALRELADEIEEKLPQKKRGVQ